MNVPDFPTDNLYKFMALTGIAVALLTFYLAHRRVDEALALNETYVLERALIESELVTIEGEQAQVESSLVRRGVLPSAESASHKRSDQQAEAASGREHEKGSSGPR